MSIALKTAAIEIRTDKAGREFAQYWCRGAMRWIRMSLIEAKAILAERGVDQ